MSLQIIDRAGNVLGTLLVPKTTKIVDLEPLRLLGASKIEIVGIRA
jgi:hypothetical protein